MSGHPTDRLSALLDGELAGGERADVDAHVQECAVCARHLAELRALGGWAAEIPTEPAPPGYFEALPRRVTDRLRAPRRAAPLRLPAWTWAVAAALMVAVVAPLTLRQAARPEVRELPEPPPRDAARLRQPESAAPTSLIETKAPDAVAPPPAPQSPPRIARRPEVPPAAPRAAAPLPEQDTGAPSLQKAREEEDEAPAPADAPAAPKAPTSTVPARSEAAPETRAFAVPPPAEARQEEAETREAGTQTHVPLADNAYQVGGSAAPAAGLAAAGAVGESAEESEFRRLVARPVASAEAARAAVKAWTAYLTRYPRARFADEAAVRRVESAVDAFRLGGTRADLALAQDHAREYLARAGAPQKERVRAALARLETR